eukprot:1600448-Pleurochrysis_carterae.AAC.1
MHMSFVFIIPSAFVPPSTPNVALLLTSFSLSTFTVYSCRAACCWARVGAFSRLALARSPCIRLASSCRYARSFSQSLPCAHAHSSHQRDCSLRMRAPRTVWYVCAVWVLGLSERLWNSAYKVKRVGPHWSSSPDGVVYPNSHLLVAALVRMPLTLTYSCCTVLTTTPLRSSLSFSVPRSLASAPAFLSTSCTCLLMTSLPSGLDTLRKPPATAGRSMTPVQACGPPPPRIRVTQPSLASSPALRQSAICHSPHRS